MDTYILLIAKKYVKLCYLNYHDHVLHGSLKLLSDGFMNLIICSQKMRVKS